MKRIILGISVLLMLIQNVFAESDHKAYRKVLSCESEAFQYKTRNVNPELCIEAAHSIENGEDLGILSNDK